MLVFSRRTGPLRPYAGVSMDGRGRCMDNAWMAQHQVRGGVPEGIPKWD